MPITRIQSRHFSFFFVSSSSSTSLNNAAHLLPADFCLAAHPANSSIRSPGSASPPIPASVPDVNCRHYRHGAQNTGEVLSVHPERPRLSIVNAKGSRRRVYHRTFFPREHRGFIGILRRQSSACGVFQSDIVMGKLSSSSNTQRLAYKRVQAIIC